MQLCHLVGIFGDVIHQVMRNSTCVTIKKLKKDVVAPRQQQLQQAIGQ